MSTEKKKSKKRAAVEPQKDVIDLETSPSPGKKFKGDDGDLKASVSEMACQGTKHNLNRSHAGVLWFELIKNPPPLLFFFFYINMINAKTKTVSTVMIINNLYLLCMKKSEILCDL